MKILSIFLFLPSLLFAQKDSTDIIVKRLMDQQKIVGLSLAVIKEGRSVVNKGYGLANVELNVPVTSETVIRLGSVSKQLRFKKDLFYILRFNIFIFRFIAHCSHLRETLAPLL